MDILWDITIGALCLAAALIIGVIVFASICGFTFLLLGSLGSFASTKRKIIYLVLWLFFFSAVFVAQDRCWLHELGLKIGVGYGTTCEER